MRWLYLAAIVTTGLVAVFGVAYGLIAFVHWDWPPMQDSWALGRAYIAAWVVAYVALIPAALSTWPANLSPEDEA